MSLKGFIFSFLWIAALLTIGSVIRFSMFDELLCIFILFSAIKQGLFRNRIAVALMVYFFIHTMVSFCFGYNTVKAILLDSLMYAKPFVCAIACGSGFFVLKTKDNASLNKIVYVLLFVCFVDAFVAIASGARDVASRPPFWFTTNCTLAGTTTLMFLFYMFTGKDKIKEKLTSKTLFQYIVLILTAVITMQGKYWGFVFCFFLLKFFCSKVLPKIQSNKPNVRFYYKINSSFLFALIFFGAIYLSLDDIYAYYLTDNENVARAMMARSIPKVLAGTYFFTGRGFGAFCSPVTSIHYPPHLMDELGLSNVYGLSRAFSNLMSDGYVWSFIGCFGFVGIILYGLFLVYMIKPFFALLKKKKLPTKLAFASLTCFSWIMIFSFGSGLMFGYGVFVMLLWGMLRWKAVCLLRSTL